MLILPNETQPLRLFYEDWNRNMEFFQKQFEQFHKLFNNGFINPNEIHFRKDPNAKNNLNYLIGPFHSGIFYKGFFFRSDNETKINFEQMNVKPGDYFFYVTIDKTLNEFDFPNDPFQKKHQYLDFKLNFHLEPLDIGAKLNEDKIFIKALNIDAEYNIVEMSYNTKSQMSYGKFQTQRQIGEIVFYPDFIDLNEKVIECKGQSFLVQDKLEFIKNASYVIPKDYERICQVKITNQLFQIVMDFDESIIHNHNPKEIRFFRIVSLDERIKIPVFFARTMNDSQWIIVPMKGHKVNKAIFTDKKVYLEKLISFYIPDYQSFAKANNMKLAIKI